MPDKLMTIEEVSEVLQVHRSTIYRMLKDKKIAGMKIGSEWRFTRESIERFIQDSIEAAA